MKQHKITAMLLSLCTLLSVTACADRSSAEDQIESTAEHSADFTDSENNGSRGDESKAEDSGEAAQTTVTQQTEAPQQTVTRTTVTLPPDEKPVLLKEMQSVKKGLEHHIGRAGGRRPCRCGERRQMLSDRHGI